MKGRIVLLLLLSMTWTMSCSGSSGGDDMSDSVDVGTDHTQPDVEDVADVKPDEVGRPDVQEIRPDPPDMDIGEVEPDVDLTCPQDCDDQDECTEDRCEEGVGCVHMPISGCCEGQIPFQNAFGDAATVQGFGIRSLVPTYPDAPNLPHMVWSFSTQKSRTPGGGSLYFGNPMAQNYDNGHRVAAEAVTPTLELEAGARYALDLWMFLDVEAGPYSDFLTIWVLRNGQMLPLWTKGASDETGRWINRNLDLSPYGGATVQLVFRFDSANEIENSSMGVFLDEIVVTRDCAKTTSCSSVNECNDSNACTDQACVAGHCSWTFRDKCCLVYVDCEDWNNCTIEKCISNQCAFQTDPDPLCCNESSQCDDGDDQCTIDVCKNGKCRFLPSGAAGCCTLNSECNDDDPCTIDRCQNNTCRYVNICCSSDLDCDDGDHVCTNDYCSQGTCRFIPSGAQGCCFPAVVDEGFESGTAEGWALDATNPLLLSWKVGSFDAFQGDKSLAIVANNISTLLSAEARLPLGVLPAVGGVLTFYVKQKMEYSGNCNNNKFSVTFNGQELVAHCNSMVEWVKVTVPLAAHAGQVGTLAMKFQVGTSSLGSYRVYVDRVQLTQSCCSSHSECSDDNPCTEDVCPGTNSICQFHTIPGCCLGDSECKDDNPCTLDRCSENVCAYIDQCCTADADCTDNDPVCTQDRCINSWCYFQPTGAAGCCTPERYFESFEGSGLPAGWVVSNTSDQYGWRISGFKANSGAQSLYYGDVFATAYGTTNSGTATSGPMFVPSAPSATLSAYLWYDTESNWDKLTLSIVTESGSSTLGQVSGNSMGWVPVSYDISSFMGRTVQLRAHFNSDFTTSMQGVFIDDIRIALACCGQDAQCNDGNLCTQDFCPGQEANCANVPVEGCCIRHDQCWDADPCTVDRCLEDHTCSHVDVCCLTDGDCDDGDDVCTTDLCVGNFCYFQPTGATGCCQPQAALFDFEDGKLTDWVIDNNQALHTWRLGTVQTAGGSAFSLYYGNETETTYGGSADASIQNRNWIQLPAAKTLTLQMDVRYHVENCCDSVTVFLITGTGTVQLQKMAGNSLGWVKRTYDLSQYSGQTVKLKLVFKSDSSLQNAGAWFDNIEILKSCCSIDTDCDDGNLCTQDSCPGEQSDCINRPIPGCCTATGQCNDSNACTTESCVNNVCQYVHICCGSDEDCIDADDVCTLDRCVNSFCLNTWIPGPTCCQESFQGYNFEGASGLAGFQVTTTSNATWYVTNASAVSGTQCLAFSRPGGTDYGPNANGSLLTPVANLPGTVADPKLSFWIRYHTETNHDRLRLYVVRDGTETLLDTYTGSSNTSWARRSYPLDAYVGSSIRFKFLFTSDGSINSYFGVQIDDLYVEQECCHSPMDCHDGNPCTVDICTGASGYCGYAAMENCCVWSFDCDDGDECTMDVCGGDSRCRHVNVCCDSRDDCDDGDDVCTYDLCSEGGHCDFLYTGAPGCCTEPIFYDDFSQDRGWEYDSQWQRGKAKASSCSHAGYNNDPSQDHTGTADNYLAGVVVGGCVHKTALKTYYITSPVMPTAGVPLLRLAYWRWLNSDKTDYMDNTVEVFNGTQWVKVWNSGPNEVKDNAWKFVSHDISAYANSKLRVRFSTRVMSTSAWNSSSWNLDDVVIYRTPELLCCQGDTDCAGFGFLCANGACASQCTPFCYGRECGSDGCGGSCGTCKSEDVCLSSRQCCTPECAGKQCGDNGCGGSCGVCGINEACTDDLCDCLPDAVPCAGVCCDAGLVCFEEACCQPNCLGKVCGGDGCGGSCGECKTGFDCNATQQCQCDYAVKAFSDDVQRVTSLVFGKGGFPGEALNVDDRLDTCAPSPTCVAGLDNQLGGVVQQLSSLVDFSGILQSQIQAGIITLVLEFTDFAVDGTPFVLNVYTGQPATGACAHMVDHCPYLLDLESFDPVDCSSWVSLNNAAVAGNSLKAGGQGTQFVVPMPLGEGMTIPIVADNARITGTVEELPGGGWRIVDGLVAGAVSKALLLATVEAIPEGWPLPLPKPLLLGLLDVLLVADIDTDRDSLSDSVSVGVRFSTVSGLIQGVLP